MKTILRFVSVVLIGSSAAFTTAYSLAATAPAAAEFYPFIGNWHGHGQLAEAGQKPAKLAVSVHCRKVASGWAVRCTLQAKNKQMTMTESDLMGVDPVTGQAHWYAVTNQGETHDHLAQWPAPHTMQAHYDWTQDGKHMHEEIMFNFKGKVAMDFRSVVTVDGKQAGVFSAALRH